MVSFRGSEETGLKLKPQVLIEAAGIPGKGILRVLSCRTHVAYKT